MPNEPTNKLEAASNFFLPFLSTPYAWYKNKTKFHRTMYGWGAIGAVLGGAVGGLIVDLELKSLLSAGPLGVVLLVFIPIASSWAFRFFGFLTGSYATQVEESPSFGEVVKSAAKFAFVAGAGDEHYLSIYPTTFMSQQDDGSLQFKEKAAVEGVAAAVTAAEVCNEFSGYESVLSASSGDLLDKILETQDPLSTAKNIVSCLKKFDRKGYSKFTTPDNALLLDIAATREIDGETRFFWIVDHIITYTNQGILLGKTNDEFNSLDRQIRGKIKLKITDELCSKLEQQGQPKPHKLDVLREVFLIIKPTLQERNDWNEFNETRAIGWASEEAYEENCRIADLSNSLVQNRASTLQEILTRLDSWGLLNHKNFSRLKEGRGHLGHLKAILKQLQLPILMDNVSTEKRQERFDKIMDNIQHVEIMNKAIGSILHVTYPRPDMLPAAFAQQILDDLLLAGKNAQVLIDCLAEIKKHRQLLSDPIHKAAAQMRIDELTAQIETILRPIAPINAPPQPNTGGSAPLIEHKHPAPAAVPVGVMMSVVKTADHPVHQQPFVAQLPAPGVGVGQNPVAQPVVQMDTMKR